MVNGHLTWVEHILKTAQAASDSLIGGAMLFTAVFVFVYYTTWAILLVRGARRVVLTF